MANGATDDAASRSGGHDAQTELLVGSWELLTKTPEPGKPGQIREDDGEHDSDAVRPGTNKRSLRALLSDAETSCSRRTNIAKAWGDRAANQDDGVAKTLLPRGRGSTANGWGEHGAADTVATAPGRAPEADAATPGGKQFITAVAATRVPLRRTYAFAVLPGGIIAGVAPAGLAPGAGVASAADAQTDGANDVRAGRHGAAHAGAHEQAIAQRRGSDECTDAQANGTATATKGMLLLELPPQPTPRSPLTQPAAGRPGAARRKGSGQATQARNKASTANAPANAPAPAPTPPPAPTRMGKNLDYFNVRTKENGEYAEEAGDGGGGGGDDDDDVVMLDES